MKNQNDQQINKDTIAPPKDEVHALYEYEKMASFPGGEIEFLKFIDHNINKTIVGDTTLEPKRASFSFDIDTLGRIFNVKVRVSYNPTIDKECMRVLSIMPNWTPYSVMHDHWEKEIGTYVMPFKIPWKCPDF